MAAPCFTSPEILHKDLITLGFPHASDDSVNTRGKARLAALTWLATQVDPTFNPTTAENLAAFWNRLGIHSAGPNSAGHRIPFTAPADRPRDKNAANCFMRAAIDLVFAFRARREEDPTSASWAHDSDEVQGQGQGQGQNDQDEPLSTFDTEAMEQINVLINQRHLLFPNSTKLLSVNPAKKRPLQRRHISNNKNHRSRPPAKRSEKADANHVPSREYVLDRLRQVQHRAQDLEAEMQEYNGEGQDKESAGDTCPMAYPEEGTITKLASDAERLCNLVLQFDGIAKDGLDKRSKRADLAKRDLQMEATTSELSWRCKALEDFVRHTVGGIRRIQVSVKDMEHTKHVLDGLPDSATVRELQLHRQRALRHL